MDQILTARQFSEVTGRFTAPPGLDYETNGKPLQARDSRIVGISLAAPVAAEAPPHAFYIPIAHQQGQNCDAAVVPAFTDWLARHPVVPFHLSTEVAWSVAKWRVSPRVVADGYYAARVLQLTDKNLKDLATSVLRRPEVITRRTLLPDSDDFSTLHAQDDLVNRYVEADALNAYDLALDLGARVRGAGLQAAYELELLAAMLLAEHEAAGYVVSQTVFQQAIERERDRVATLERRIFGQLGGTPFSISAPQQLGKRLKALGIAPQHTPRGNESWSVDSLKLLENPPPVVAEIIDWKKSFSVMNSLQRAPIQPDASGRIFPHWLSMGYSGTPRIYSEHPSLTTLPKAARVAFTAPAGQRWLMIAYKQPEMRALALLSGDQNMLALFNTAYDFYTTVGATTRMAKPGEGTPEDREVGKELMLAALDYCGDPVKVGARLDTDGRQAMTVVYGLFPQLEPYFASVRLQAAQGVVTSFLQRRWQLNPVDEDPAVTAMAVLTTHTVATWLKIVLAKLASHAELHHPALRGFGQILPVFDKLYYVIDAGVPLVPHLSYLTTVVEPVFRWSPDAPQGVRLAAEYGTGPSWGEIDVIGEPQFAQMLADFQKVPE